MGHFCRSTVKLLVPLHGAPNSNMLLLAWKGGQTKPRTTNLNPVSKGRLQHLYCQCYPGLYQSTPAGLQNNAGLILEHELPINDPPIRRSVALGFLPYCFHLCLAFCQSRPFHVYYTEGQLSVSPVAGTLSRLWVTAPARKKAYSLSQFKQ